MEIDAGRIMEEIRSRIAERKRSGFYRDDEIEEISRMELDLREQEGYGEEMDRLISWLHAHWEATGPVEREERAPGRPLREAVKKVLNAILRPVARLLLSKQNQINARVAQLLSGALPHLRDGMSDANERIDGLLLRLEEENHRLRERAEGLEVRLKKLEDRIGKDSSGVRRDQ